MIGILIRLGATIVVCVLAVFTVNFIFKRIERKSKSIHFRFFSRLINVIIIAVGIYNCLGVFEVTKSLGSSLMKGSALLLAIATLAAQQTLGNVISGLTLTVTKPYNTGDKIRVMNGSNIIAEGLVEDITIRHTIIKTFDGQSSIVPNSIMDSSVIVNTNFTANVGNFLEIEVGYDSDVDLAIELEKKIIAEHPLTLNDDSMTITVSAYTDNGVILKTAVWTKELSDNFLACSDIRRSVLKAFKEHNITIPYQTVTVLENK